MILKNLIHILLPGQCIACHKVLGYDMGICTDCLPKINFITSPFCLRCGYPQNEHLYASICSECFEWPDCITTSRSPLIYNELAKKLIMTYKNAQATYLAKNFSIWMKNCDRDIFDDVTLVTCVPLHWQRMIWRGFNQAAMLAKLVSQSKNITSELNLLSCYKVNSEQKTSSKQQRKKNMENRFYLTQNNNLSGEVILIIDDVLTTGSTLISCAKVINKAGCNDIRFLSLARVLKHEH